MYLYQYLLLFSVTDISSEEKSNKKNLNIFKNWNDFEVLNFTGFFIFLFFFGRLTFVVLEILEQVILKKTFYDFYDILRHEWTHLAAVLQ